MKTKSTQLPVSRVEIDTIGDTTTVTLWDGTYSNVFGVGNPEDGGQNRVEYEYQLYQIPVRQRPGLAEAIEAQFDDWYAAAMEREATENAAREAEQIEREMSGNILTTLLDYDFRLMMLEEMGNL